MKNKIEKQNGSDGKLLEKIFYSFIGQFFPISMEREEHKTRVIDRIFFTFLSYVSTPLYFVLFSVALRLSHNSQFYPFHESMIEEQPYIRICSFALLSCFFSFIMFLIIRYFLQRLFNLSVLNHPLGVLKSNIK
eukprot:gene9715-11930_t